MYRTWTTVFVAAGLIPLGCAPTASLSGEFACIANSDCPNGETCDLTTNSCQSPKEAADDGGSRGPHDAGAPDSGRTLSANTAYICKPCSTESECGGGGDLCVSMSGRSGMVCGSACTSDTDCPVGDSCAEISGQGMNCLPTSGECPGGSTDAGSHPEDAGLAPVDGGTHVIDAGPVDAGVPVDAGCTPDTWGNFAQAFFANDCDSCHSHNHDFSQNISNVTSDQSTINLYISTGIMPQGTTLDPTTKSRILKWLSCGDPL